HRQAAYHEPAVGTGGAADTVFDVIRTPGFYRADPPRHHHLAFIRMQKWTPIGELVEGPARIVQDYLIEEFELTSRSHRAQESGNGIDDEPKILFLSLQIRIKARVLERNRGLRSQQVQYGNPARSEGARSQIVLQI